jgi:hypothetical protein
MPRASRILVLAAWAVWLGLVVVLTLHHEPWRDEADSWLMARDAPLRAFLPFARHAGTPLLWYALLVPLAKAGLPFAAQPVLHVVLAGAAVWLLLTRAPFPVGARILMAFGYFLSFEYAVVSRSYVLVVLGLFALAARPPPTTWVDGVVVALLANSSAHGFLLAGVVLVVWFDRLPKVARLVSTAGLLLALWQLWPPPDGQFTPVDVTRNLGLLPGMLPQALVLNGRDAWALAAGYGLAAMALLRLRGHPRSLLLLHSGWGALLALFVSVYWGDFRHAGLLALWLVFVLWRDAAERPALQSPGPWRAAFSALVLVSLLAGISLGVRAWRLDFLHPYSEGADMASFLRSRHLALEPVAAHGASQAESVLVLLPKRTFWYPAIEEDGSFMKWDTAYARGRDVPVLEALGRVRRHFPPGRRPLLLFNVRLPSGAAPDYRLLYSTPGDLRAIVDERFFLYAPEPETER